MNMLHEIRSLSPWVYCWFVLFVIAWLLSFIWCWQFSLCTILFSIPFILFISWWYKNRMHCSLNHTLKPFLHGYINITLLSIFAQSIGLAIIASICVVSQCIYHSVGYLFFIMVAITYYVFIEEILKLYFSLKSRDSISDPLNQINKAHTITSTATGLGYSMCTGMLWTAFAAFKLHDDDKKYNDKYSLFGWLFLITLIIAVIAMPMHLITGYVTGCKITQKDLEYSQRNDGDAELDDSHSSHSSHDRLPFKSYINVIYNSVLIRSAYLFFLIVGFLVLKFNPIGVLIALIGIILDYVLLIKHAKQIESRLPFDYLQRAGQLSIFGYNVLSDADAPDLYNQGVIPITAVSLDNFATDLDAPMVVNINATNAELEDDEEMRYKKCDLIVPHCVLSLTGSSSSNEGSSEHDSNSIR